MNNSTFQIAESVRKGHPDKFCDRLADRILDAHLKQDPNARVAIEAMVCSGRLIIAGEVTSRAYVDYYALALMTIADTGYQTSDIAAADGDFSIDVRVHTQSPDIAHAVDNDGDNLGAGDQGIAVGYATDETPEKLPMPVVLAHKLCRTADNYKPNAPWLGADGKTQVTVRYEGDKPVEVTCVVISLQHNDSVDMEYMRDEVMQHIVLPSIPAPLLTENTQILINPSGRFVLGGPAADTGLTGRKLAVDQYGPAAHIGGGALCVDGETEFLTPTGWKRMPEYQDGDFIAEWDNDELRFVKPLNYIKTPAMGLYRIKSSDALDMVISENHDIVILTERGNVIKKRLKEFMPEGKIQKGHFGTIPTSFSYNNNSVGVPYTDDQIRLQVAFCADGSLQNNCKLCKIRVKRECKKLRLEKLLQATETNYRVSQDSDFSIYYFTPPAKEKLLSNLFWSANSHQLSIIAEEVLLWDGDAEAGVYRTTKKADADFVQFAFMATSEKNASIVVDDRLGEAYMGKYIRKSMLYEVRQKSNKGTEFRYGEKAKPYLSATLYHSEDPYMYCFSVNSGMLLLRRNNRVFVTGNSGKDTTKVDRSAAYYARYIAVNLVAAGLAKRCEVQLAYAIGVTEPVSVSVTSFGTSVFSDGVLAEIVKRVFDARPASIIRQLDLRRPIYEPLACYGHFGRIMLQLPWEREDKVSALLEAAGDAVLEGACT